MISISFITDFQLNQQCSNMSKQDGLHAELSCLCDLAPGRI